MKIARLALTQKFPFYAPALWSLHLIESKLVPTAAVDRGGRLYYNPQFLAGLTPRQITGLLWHELEHLLRQHLERGDKLGLLDSRDQRLWNIADDCAINDDAKSAGLELPPNGLYPQDFGLEPGGLEEQYFWELKGGFEKKCPQSSIHVDPRVKGMTHTHASAGERQVWELPQEHPIYPALRPGELDKLRQKVAQAALEHHQRRGDLPLGVLRWAQQVGDPRVPWQRLLGHYVRRGVRLGTGHTRASYERPHRRQGVYRDVVLPGSYDSRPHVAVVLDTSGSVNEAMLGQALTEVGGILRRAKAEVTVSCVDATVYAAQRIRRAQQLRLWGGGGTDLRLGIEAALQLRPRPNAVVVLTDGHTPWPDTSPALPVIAGIFGKDAPAVPEYVRCVRVEGEY